ncbi:leishmanolysin-like peptidase-like [Scleropages formosus]|uniref:Leishmanolysin-like peptidase n=1 Tax=Scleropages formosus TaxID=113540 RepID=A0A0N8JX13_SCLFO|nr:leishmanolysin-like peptidase-like [Scleropages formosus]
MTARRRARGCCWKRFGALSRICALALLVLSVHGHTCKHRAPAPSEVVYKVYLKTPRITKRNAEHQLRIKIIYDASVEKTNSFLKPSIICRRRFKSVGKLDRCCSADPCVAPETQMGGGDAACPPQQCTACSETGKPCDPVGPPDGEGVDGADFLLYVSGVTTERCGQENVVAYAAYCQLESELDRPIAGYANLCPSMISTQPQEFVGMLSTVKHEIIHALGFSAGLFAFYHDDNGKPLTQRYAGGLPPFNESLGLYQWSDKVVRKAKRLWNISGNTMVSHEVHLLVTPRVVEEARKHFDCPILEGMELENQGGLGTELNHWEKRLLENEAMTGSHTQNRMFSRITLAIMEDTGWYHANYSMAERLDWGRGMGCDFVMKSCKFWIDQQRQKKLPLSPYCDMVRSTPLKLTCRHDQRAVAVCNLQKYSRRLPQEYQYFDYIPGIPTEDLPFYGGAVEIADYCPFSQEFSWHLSGEYQRGSDCRVLENQPDSWRNYGAEEYGPNSLCLYQKSAFVMEQCTRRMSYPDWGSGCYKTTCSALGLTVWVQGMPFHCFYTGQLLKINVRVNTWVYSGDLVCPACSRFCSSCPLPHELPPLNASQSIPIGQSPTQPSISILTSLLTKQFDQY